MLRYSPAQADGGKYTVLPPPVVVPVAVRQAPVSKTDADALHIVVDVSAPTARGMRWPSIDAALQDVTLVVDLGSANPTVAA